MTIDKNISDIIFYTYSTILLYIIQNEIYNDIQKEYIYLKNEIMNIWKLQNKVILRRVLYLIAYNKVLQFIIGCVMLLIWFYDYNN